MNLFRIFRSIRIRYLRRLYYNADTLHPSGRCERIYATKYYNSYNKRDQTHYSMATHRWRPQIKRQQSSGGLSFLYGGRVLAAM